MVRSKLKCGHNVRYLMKLIRKSRKQKNKKINQVKKQTSKRHNRKRHTRKMRGSGIGQSKYETDDDDVEVGKIMPRLSIDEYDPESNTPIQSPSLQSPSLYKKLQTSLSQLSMGSRAESPFQSIASNEQGPPIYPVNETVIDINNLKKYPVSSLDKRVKSQQDEKTRQEWLARKKDWSKTDIANEWDKEFDESYRKSEAERKQEEKLDEEERKRREWLQRRKNWKQQDLAKQMTGEETEAIKEYTRVHLDPERAIWEKPSDYEKRKSFLESKSRIKELSALQRMPSETRRENKKNRGGRRRKTHRK